MARVCLKFCFVLMQWSLFVFGEDSENVTTSILNETIINVTIPIPKESYINVTNQVLNETYYGNGSDSILNDPVLEGFDPKSLLRYGHHRTYECVDFVQAYKCIARCLKNGFDIAVADKSCSCTCIEDKEKAKFYELATEFRIPTTTKPAWAVSSTSPTTTMSGRTKVIGGEHIYYQSDEGSSVEKNTTEHESDHSHEHTEEDSEEHASSEHSSEGHSSEDHSSEQHSSEHHSSEQHSTEEHTSSEEHATEEHESEDHPTEEHETEEHHSDEHHSDEHHSDEAEAEERADVGAEND